ncbi:MAG: hypothetical protein NW237_01005 [Cyanobacteriota bacterium]|nr:hypothetical protein [Cyanobacteriota bacterium]
MEITSNNIPIPINSSRGESRAGIPPSFPLTLPPRLDPQAWLEQLASGEVWVVKGGQSQALILEKPHTADFLGFGAALGMNLDRHCQAVIPLGEVSLHRPRSFLEQQWAYRRRQYWIEWQQRLTEAYPLQQRGSLLWQALQDILPMEIVQSIPDVILGKMVGISPEMMAATRPAPPWLATLGRPVVAESTG